MPTLLAKRHDPFQDIPRAMDLRPYVIGTNARVVTTIKLAMVPMSLGVINPTSSFSVLACFRRCSFVQAGRPRTVMRLQK